MCVTQCVTPALQLLLCIVYLLWNKAPCTFAWAWDRQDRNVQNNKRATDFIPGHRRWLHSSLPKHPGCWAPCYVEFGLTINCAAYWQPCRRWSEVTPTCTGYICASGDQLGTTGSTGLTGHWAWMTLECLCGCRWGTRHGTARLSSAWKEMVFHVGWCFIKSLP